MARLIASLTLLCALVSGAFAQTFTKEALWNFETNEFEAVVSYKLFETEDFVLENWLEAALGGYDIDFEARAFTGFDEEGDALAGFCSVLVVPLDKTGKVAVYVGGAYVYDRGPALIAGVRF